MTAVSIQEHRLQPELIIYGTILALSVLIALDYTELSAFRVITVMLVTMIAGTLAHSHVHIIGRKLEPGRLDERQGYRDTLAGIMQSLLPAVPIIIVFLLAAISLIEIQMAFTIAQGLLGALLFATGFYLRRQADGSLIHSVRDGLFDLMIGLVIIALKYLAH